MQETPNYKLPLYEMDDMANLNDGYNGAMNIIDNELKGQADDFSNKFPLQSTDLDSGIITASKMAANAINTVNIVDGAITNSKLAADSVETDNIKNGAIINDNLADDSVQTDKIVDGAVTNAKLAANSVQSDNIVDGAISNAKLAANSVQSDNIVDGAISNAKLAANSVQSDNIVDGGVTNAKLAGGVVTIAKIADTAFDGEPTTDSDNLVASGAVKKYVDDSIAGIDLSGEVNTDDIVDGAVTLPKIASSAFDTTPTYGSNKLVSSGSIINFWSNNMLFVADVFTVPSYISPVPIVYDVTILSNMSKTLIKPCMKISWRNSTANNQQIVPTLIPGTTDSYGVKLFDASSYFATVDNPIVYNAAGFWYNQNLSDGSTRGLNVATFMVGTDKCFYMYYSKVANNNILILSQADFIITMTQPLLTTNNLLLTPNEPTEGINNA